MTSAQCIAKRVRLEYVTAGPGRCATSGRQRRLQAIRRRIKEGTYDVDARLAVILDRVFDDLKCGDCGRTVKGR